MKKKRILGVRESYYSSKAPSGVVEVVKYAIHGNEEEVSILHTALLRHNTKMLYDHAV